MQCLTITYFVEHLKYQFIVNKLVTIFCLKVIDIVYFVKKNNFGILKPFYNCAGQDIIKNKLQ